MKVLEILSESKNDGSELISAIGNFLPLAMKHLKLKSLPKINFGRNVGSQHDHPTFGIYHHDSDKSIELDIEERHPIDIIRTLAHELVHYRQDLEGKLDNTSWTTGSPTEDEAHKEAGVMMREFNKQYPSLLKTAKAISFNK